MERNAAEPEHFVLGPRPGDLVRDPSIARRMRDVVLEVPLPRIGDQDEAVPRVPEALLEAPAHRPAHEIARDDRVSVVQDARDGAWLFAERAPEIAIERVERV